jgi:hypothetical protein
MCLHEVKTCQRCSIAFECKRGSVTQCQCYEVILSTGERACVEQRYSDCLCKNCLLQPKEEFELFKEQFIFQ